MASSAVPVVYAAKQRELTAAKREEAKAKRVQNAGDTQDKVYHLKTHKRKLASGKVVTAFALCKVSDDTKKKSKQLGQLLDNVVATAGDLVKGLVESLNQGAITEDEALKQLNEAKGSGASGSAG